MLRQHRKEHLTTYQGIAVPQELQDVPNQWSLEAKYKHVVEEREMFVRVIGSKWEAVNGRK